MAGCDLGGGDGGHLLHRPADGEAVGLALTHDFPQAVARVGAGVVFHGTEAVHQGLLLFLHRLGAEVLVLIPQRVEDHVRQQLHDPAEDVHIGILVGQEGLLQHLGGIADHVGIPVEVIADGEGGTVQLVQPSVEKREAAVVLTPPTQDPEQEGGEGRLLPLGRHNREQAQAGGLEAAVPHVAETDGGI